MIPAKIISDPKILSGKPIIAGTRISVELILDRISSGMSESEILLDYPHLNKKQIEVVLDYAKSLVSAQTQVKSDQKSKPVTLYTHEISR